LKKKMLRSLRIIRPAQGALVLSRAASTAVATQGQTSESNSLVSQKQVDFFFSTNCTKAMVLLSMS